MMIRTANGSLMKVTTMEGQRMIDEHPFDYSHELDACEVCEKESWTVQGIIAARTPDSVPVRMCYQCYKDKGGSNEGWNDALNFNLKKEKSNG